MKSIKEKVDLMTDDWVKTPEGNYRVLGVLNDVVYTDFRNDERDGMAFSDELVEPIPLTPEILEKNGWMYIAEDKVFYSENLKGELPWIYYITDGSNEVFRMKDFCNLQYVHQLQHALRLCGITREIIL